MFARSYEQMTDVSIMEVKTYLLIHSEGVYQQDIYDLIDNYDTLEGEEVHVVLPNDLIEGD